MAYKNIPWYCFTCNRHFRGALGKASHYASARHKANLPTPIPADKRRA